MNMFGRDDAYVDIITQARQVGIDIVPTRRYKREEVQAIRI